MAQLVFVELPLTPGPSLFGTTIGGIDLRFRLSYANTEGGGWFIDIADADGKVLVAGLPLTAGLNLMDSFAYLGLRFAMYIRVDGRPDEAPTYEDMGTNLHIDLVTVQ